MERAPTKVWANYMNKWLGGHLYWQDWAQPQQPAVAVEKIRSQLSMRQWLVQT